MPHLAGAPCGVCQQLLIGVRDGAFCPVCECPVHLDCAHSATAETLCPRCGAQKKLAEQWRERELACEREKQLDDLEHRPNTTATVVEWSLSAVFGQVLVIPLFVICAVVLIPVLLWKRLRHGPDQTPSHLDPAKRLRDKPWNRIDPEA